MSNTQPDRALDQRRRRVEGLLWDWAEHLQTPESVTGYPSTSPTYRMMQAATPDASGRSSTCDQWHGRQQRRGGELTITPAGACHHRETRSAKIGDLTQPETDADLMGPSTQMITQIVATFPAYQRDILMIRFIERVRDFREIATILRGQAQERGYSASGCDRNTVAVLYKQALDHIYRLRFETAEPARRSIVPDFTGQYE